MPKIIIVCADCQSVYENIIEEEADVYHIDNYRCNSCHSRNIIKDSLETENERAKRMRPFG